MVHFRGVIENYDSQKQWGIGPRLLTKVVKKYCKIEDFAKSTDCGNFTILPIEKCYAIKGSFWYKFYEESHMDSVLDQTRNSYFIHLWNFQSSKKKISTSTKNAFNVLASRYCSRTFENNDKT